jgi:hypothetical protein
MIKASVGCPTLVCWGEGAISDRGSPQVSCGVTMQQLSACGFPTQGFTIQSIPPTGMHLVLDIKCQIFLTDVNQIGYVWIDFLKLSSIKFHENSLSGSRVVSCAEADSVNLTNWHTNWTKKRSSWEADSMLRGLRNFQHFMEPESSLPCSQKPAFFK